MIVVDEVQQAEPEALALLTRLAGQLGADQRLLLIGREAPIGLGSLRRNSAAVWLGTADLAMTTPEVAALCRQGFGLAVSEARPNRSGRPPAAGLRPSCWRPARPDRPISRCWPTAPAAPRKRRCWRCWSSRCCAGSRAGALGGRPGGSSSAAARADRGARNRRTRAPRGHQPGGAAAAGERRRLVRAHRSGPAPAGGARPGQDRGADRGGGRLRRGGTPRTWQAGLLIGAGRADDAAALLAAMSPREAERLGLDELARLAALPAARSTSSRGSCSISRASASRPPRSTGGRRR